MQLYVIQLFLQNALHVSGGSCAHHQELKTVHIALGFFKLILLPATIVQVHLKHVEHFAEINDYIKLHIVGYAWEYKQAHHCNVYV
jgi:hypothetical protein